MFVYLPVNSLGSSVGRATFPGSFRERGKEPGKHCLRMRLIKIPWEGPGCEATAWYAVCWGVESRLKQLNFFCMKK